MYSTASALYVLCLVKLADTLHGDHLGQTSPIRYHAPNGGFRLAWDELQHTHHPIPKKSCHMPLRGARTRIDRTGLTGYAGYGA